ncbi:MAG: phosphopantetheine-binding protein [Sulfurovum sp.]|nr:phosphopantetheine-binding protein [Sulfurovum sp.]
MGLDLVELALRVEDEFDVPISDADLAEATTPRKLANIIYQQYQTIDKEGKLIQKSFYQVRDIFIKHFGFTKEQLHPHTKLETLFPDDTIKKWKALNKHLPNEIYYSLKFPKKLLIGIWIFASVLSLSLGYIYKLDFYVILFSILGIFSMTYMILKPLFANQFPPQIETLSDLIRYVGGSKKLDTYKNEKEILDKIIEISIDELGLKPEDIHPDSHYVDDLGAG